MRVLGVDPGLTRCGLGVVDGGLGKPLTMVAVGVVRTPVGEPVPQRLLALQIELEAWFEQYRPDAIAVERVFARNDVSTIMGTAQASAIPMLAAARRGLPLAMHTPSEVKAAVTGNGRADKAQVTAMITRILRLTEAPRPADAADALALAVCHVWRGGAQSRIDEAVAAARRRGTTGTPGATGAAGAAGRPRAARATGAAAGGTQAQARPVTSRGSEA